MKDDGLIGEKEKQVIKLTGELRSSALNIHDSMNGKWFYGGTDGLLKKAESDATKIVDIVHDLENQLRCKEQELAQERGKTKELVDKCEKWKSQYTDSGDLPGSFDDAYENGFIAALTSVIKELIGGSND